MDIILADTIIEELEHMIVIGEFSDGERLDEIKIAERFGVSRTPVREAFQKLERFGLVQHLPRRGVFVRHPSTVELLEMFEVMAELEAVCAKLTAVRLTDEGLKALKEANKTCQDAVLQDDVEGYYRANEAFHHIIYKQSGNSFLEGEASRLHKRLKPYRKMQLHLRGRMKQSMREHENIVTALADGNVELAGQALKSHVGVQGEKFHHFMASMKKSD